ncbi:hypothetical protein BH09BAC1_BH09BAC1_06960 [soil metagenome]
MKSVIFTLLFAATSLIASAQCTPDQTMQTSGLAYEGGVVPCFAADAHHGRTIFFKNFDEVSVANNTVNVDSIKIDSIAGLPCGVSWTTNKAAQGHLFKKNEIGCFRLSGISNDGPGVYKTEMYVIAWADNNPQALPGKYPASLLNNTRIIVKVVATGTDCSAVVDTVESTCASTWTGINSVASNLAAISNNPNPFSSFTNIEFTALKSAVYTLKVVNMLGAVVYTEQVVAEPGQNNIRMERSSLPAGVYVYSISNGVHSINNRMVVAQ